MNIELDLRKSLEKNANDYYEKAKKFSKKHKGAEIALEISKKKLEELKQNKDTEIKKYEEEEKIKQKKEKNKVKKEWYEKFRWFISSTGFLCIGGRDATTNEIIVKKHVDKNDIVFHTDMAGSPFFVIKAENKKIDDKTIEETAKATITFSKAFQAGFSSTPVFWVTPEQVSKEANPGEYLSKGAFMIRGKTNYVPVSSDLAIGITKNKKIMAGPISAIKKHCKTFVELQSGKKKKSDIAKIIQKKIGGELDDIIRVLPSGNLEIL